MTRAEKIDYRKIILVTIGLMGIIALAAVAPNCVQLLRFLPNQKSKKKYYINKVINKLLKAGFLTTSKNHKGQRVVRLTDKGKGLLLEYQLKDQILSKPKKWDGRYRVIIFDIKEYKKKTREKLRQWFNHLGLVKLQNSVWVYPYDCQEIITLLKANYKIGNEVLYLEVNKIENDRWLKEIFNLK